MGTKVCYNCAYWEPRDGETGKCHRYPPKETQTWISDWPTVYVTCWCGEFKAKKGENDNGKVK